MAGPVAILLRLAELLKAEKEGQVVAFLTVQELHQAAKERATAVVLPVA